MKHHQVFKVPRGSNDLGWQSRRAPVPGPCALQGRGLLKRSLPSLLDRWQRRAWGGQEVLQGCGIVLVHLGTLNLLVLRLGMRQWGTHRLLRSPRHGGRLSSWASQGRSVDPMHVRSPDLTQI